MKRARRCDAQRRVDAWRSLHAARFPLALRRVRSSGGEYHYHFDGCSDALSLQINAGGLGVVVCQWLDDLIDFVLDIDIAPVRQRRWTGFHPARAPCGLNAIAQTGVLACVGVGGGEQGAGDAGFEC